VKKELDIWESIGFLFVIVWGTLLHFTYQWSGKCPAVGYFSPVNESTWEHLKLLFMPMLFYSIIEYFAIGKRYKGFPAAKAIGILLGMLTIVTVFYTYTGVLGTHYLPLDMITFLLGVIVAFTSSQLILQNVTIRKGTEITVLLLLAIIAVCFVIFTYHAPQIALFKDPKYHVSRLSLALI
jgi:hypothetical protein